MHSGQPDTVLASMGIYVFNTAVMYELLFQDAARKEASNYDFGRDIIPAMITGGFRESLRIRLATRTAKRPHTKATSARLTRISRPAWT